MLREAYKRVHFLKHIANTSHTHTHDKNQNQAHWYKINATKDQAIISNCQGKAVKLLPGLLKLPFNKKEAIGEIRGKENTSKPSKSL